MKGKRELRIGRVVMEKGEEKETDGEMDTQVDDGIYRAWHGISKPGTA